MSRVQIRKSNEVGQIGLVVLLIMTTLLTVGVSAVSKSTRDLRITREEVEASQAFNAAEKGIERALADVEDGSYEVEGQMEEVVVNVDVEYGVTEERQLDMSVLENQVIKVDVAGVNGGEELEIDWGMGETCPIPSMVIVVYEGAAGGYGIRRYGFNACSDSNGFENPVVEGVGRVDLVLEAGDELVRIRPVGGPSVIQVREGANWVNPMPVQYYRVESTAENKLSGVTKKIQVNKGIKTSPSVFDYALFSGTTINKTP